jgi:hypothetical protein
LCLAVGPLSLVEALLPAAFGSNQRLERYKAQVDWAQVDWAQVEALPGSMRRAPTGRPAYPPLLQLKALPPAKQAALPFLLSGKDTGCRIVIATKPWPAG